MAATYRYLFCELDGRIRRALPLSDVSFSETLSRSGAASATIATRHPQATRDTIDPGRTLLYIERNGEIVWGGFVWQVQATAGLGGQMRLGCQSLWSFLHACKLTVPLTFDLVDQLDIARTLISTAMAEDGRLLPLVLGDETSTRVRDRTYYGYEFTNVGQAVEQLSEVADGFDFAIEPRVEDDSIVNHLRLYYPRRGAPADVMFEFGATVQQLVDDVDGRQLGTRVLGVGAGEGDAMLTASTTDTGDGLYPLMDIVVTRKNVSVQATLAAHTEAMLAARSRPVQVPQLTIDVLPERPETDPFDGGWDVGDDVQVRAFDGWIQLDGQYRIVGRTVSVSDEGAEQVKLDVAPAGAYAYAEDA